MITSYIRNTKLINQDNILELRKITNKYPYFTTTQLLLTKGLHNVKDPNYNNQLKKAATYAGNREKLFALITKNIAKNKNPIKKDSLDIGQPLDFTHEERHSFSQWLNLTKVKKITRIEDKKSNEEIITKFIKRKVVQKEKINSVFFSASENAKNSIKENHNIVTETLAKVYLEQGHYEKAISSYEKLILKYPKKNIFFAKKIELINKLKK